MLSGVDVSNRRLTVPRVGPAKGLRPVCCASCWYICLNATPLGVGDGAAVGWAAGAAGAVVATGTVATPTAGVAVATGAIAGGWVAACVGAATAPVVGDGVTALLHAASKPVAPSIPAALRRRRRVNCIPARVVARPTTRPKIHKIDIASVVRA